MFVKQFLNIKNRTKIDIHTHIGKKNPEKNLKKLKYEQKKHNIKETYVMASYFQEENSGVPNTLLYGLIKNEQTFKMYLSLRFDNFEYYYNELTTMLDDRTIRKKVIGLKIYSGYQLNIDFNSEEMNMVIKLCEKFNLTLTFHTGYCFKQNMIFDIHKLRKICIKNRNLKIILAHMANPNFVKLKSYISKNNNIYTDVSGLTDKKRDLKDLINKRHILKCIPKSKILFGTDYPIQNYRTTKELLSKFFK